jgi:predicted transcriptional regulator
MATIPKPETEEKLNQLASSMHRAKDEVLDEAVDQLLAYNKWLDGKVKESLAAVERGEVVSDEDVLAWIEERERREQF